MVPCFIYMYLYVLSFSYFSIAGFNTNHPATFKMFFCVQPKTIKEKQECIITIARVTNKQWYL